MRLPVSLAALRARLIVLTMMLASFPSMTRQVIAEVSPLNLTTHGFNLPPITGLAGIPGLKDADLRRGNITIIYIFASWCMPCKGQTAILEQLANDRRIKDHGVQVVGISRDRDSGDAAEFLKREGNPFSAAAVDQSGDLSLSWKLYGVPETLVVSGDGTLLFKMVGPLTKDEVQNEIVPRALMADEQLRKKRENDARRSNAIAQCGSGEPTISGGPWFSSTYSIGAQDEARRQISGGPFFCLKEIIYISPAVNPMGGKAARAKFVGFDKYGYDIKEMILDFPY